MSRFDLELETVNELFLELSQFATAKTARELKLEESQIDDDKACVLNVLMNDPEKGWGEVSSGLEQNFQDGLNAFNIRFKDGTEHRISFKIEEI